MIEKLPEHMWDFSAHPEWQDVLSNNGIDTSSEHYTPDTYITIDEAKLSLDALHLSEFVTGQHDTMTQL